MITVQEYFAAYPDHPDATPERRAAAAGLTKKVDTLLNNAIADGVPLTKNPSTGCYISGQKNGGFRPQDCPIGAPGSTHKRGHGVDLYDPKRALTAWCYRNPAILKGLGLTMEDARWTPGWVHLQDVPPGPLGAIWRLDYIPNNTPPVCAPTPEQVAARSLPTDKRMAIS